MAILSMFFCSIVLTLWAINSCYVNVTLPLFQCLSLSHRLAFQSLQNITSDLPDWRTDVINGKIIREFQLGLLEFSSCFFFQNVVSWTFLMLDDCYCIFFYFNSMKLVKWYGPSDCFNAVIKLYCIYIYYLTLLFYGLWLQWHDIQNIW